MEGVQFHALSFRTLVRIMSEEPWKTTIDNVLTFYKKSNYTVSLKSLKLICSFSSQIG